MSTIARKRLSVAGYDKLIDYGILPETNRFELIRGRIVEKDVKGPEHRIATRQTLRAIERLLPVGWHANKEEPVGIPDSKSEPEPDISVVRGAVEDYADRNPGSGDVGAGGRGDTLKRCQGPQAGSSLRYLVQSPSTG